MIPRSRHKAILLLIAMVAITAATAWFTWPITLSYYTDANTIHEDAGTASLRNILWDPPRAFSHPVNSLDNDYEPEISDDGRLLFLVRGKAGDNADIYYCRRDKDGWSIPQPLSSVNTGYDELGPELSPDGRTLYFYSDRHDGLGGYDIWAAHRRQGDALRFDEPVNLGAGINSAYSDYGTALTPDGLSMYVASNRPPEMTSPPPVAPTPLPQTEGQPHSDNYDLYIAELEAGQWKILRPLTAVNTMHNEGSPAVTPSGDFLYFASDRPGGQGGFDLYRTRRVDGRHLPPLPLGASVNTSANELDPTLTAEGFKLLFSSDRTQPERKSEIASGYDLFWTTSREVFSASDQRSKTVPWGLLLRTIVTSLIWMMIALAVLILLWRLAGHLQNKRLSLLAKCVLASLFAHVLLLLLFTIWTVSTGLIDSVRDEGTIHVTLVSAEKSDGLVRQIRGQLTRTPPPPPSIAPSQHAADAPPAATEAIMNETQVAERAIDLPAQPISFESPADSQREMHTVVRTTISDVSADPAPPPKLALLEQNPPVAQAEPTAEPAARPIHKTTRKALEFPTVKSLAKGSTTVVHVTPESVHDSQSLQMSSLIARRDVPDSTPPVRPTDLRADTESTLNLPPPSQLTLPQTGRSSADEVARVTSAKHAIPAMRFDTLPDFTTEGSSKSIRPADVKPNAHQREGAGVSLATNPQWADDGITTTASFLPQSIKEWEPKSLPAVELSLGHLSDSLDSDAVKKTPIDEADRLPALASRVNGLSRMKKHTGSSRAGFDPKERLLGAIHGQVTDAQTGDGIAGAVVRLDLDNRSPLTAATDPNGHYELIPPDLSGFLALSAAADKFVPKSVNIAAAMIRGAALRLDFELDPQHAGIVTLEDPPRVHHLGDDRFEGSVNSRFQKFAEGRTYRVIFSLSPSQLPPHFNQVELEMLVKGVQLNHAMYVNGTRLPRSLNRSPRDGSFGRFATDFDVNLLRPGRNLFRIRANSRGRDIDDFEFVNVRLSLSP